MNAYTDKPHTKATWIRPIVYSASLAEPRSKPRVKILRSSCHHALGVGLVWRRQRYLTWKACR